MLAEEKALVFSTQTTLNGFFFITFIYFCASEIRQGGTNEGEGRLLCAHRWGSEGNLLGLVLCCREGVPGLNSDHQAQQPQNNLESSDKMPLEP